MFQLKFKSLLIALFSFAAFALFAPAPAYSQFDGKVLVTNTTSEPVPTVAQVPRTSAEPFSSAIQLRLQLWSAT
jgi:hypothetical protein